MKTNLTKKAMAFAIVMSSFYNCSTDSVDNSNLDSNLQNASQSTNCDSSDPTVRLTNNGTVVMDFEVLLAIDGSLLAEEQVLPGHTSEWISFEPGIILFSASSNVDGVKDHKVVYDMESCMEYNMQIDADNMLMDTQPQSI